MKSIVRLGRGKGARWLNGSMAGLKGRCPVGEENPFSHGEEGLDGARYCYQIGTCIPPKLRILDGTSSA